MTGSSTGAADSGVPTLARNTGSLLIMQVASYVLPLLLIPYLTRTLGASLYGVIAFGLAMAQIACVITDYGFNLSATYQIARYQSDTYKINKLIGAVITCKTILLLAVIIALIAGLSLQTKYAEYSSFFWLMIIPIVGQTFQPVWFFQGIERMAYITFYTVASRVSFLVLVFLWVKGPQDIYMVAVANGMGQILAAVMGVAMMIRLGYRPSSFDWPYIKETFRSSTSFFWSRAAVTTYTAGGTFFLGLTAVPLQVAHYSAAEQLYRGAQALFGPLSQALFPHMARHRNYVLFFRILKAVIVLCCVGIIVGYFTGPWVLRVVFGPDFASGFPVLMIFVCIFAITAPSVLLGYPFLGALGHIELANRSVLYAGVFQVVMLGLLWTFDWAEAYQVALCVMLVEAIVLGLRVKYARRYYGIHRT